MLFWILVGFGALFFCLCALLISILCPPIVFVVATGLLVLSWFEPVIAGWTFVGLNYGLGLMLLLLERQARSALVPSADRTEAEKINTRKFAYFLANPIVTTRYATILNNCRLTCLVVGPWMLWNAQWIVGTAVILFIYLMNELCIRLAPLEYYSEHARKGNQDYVSEIGFLEGELKRMIDNETYACATQADTQNMTDADSDFTESLTNETHHVRGLAMRRLGQILGTAVVCTLLFALLVVSYIVTPWCLVIALYFLAGVIWTRYDMRQSYHTRPFGYSKLWGTLILFLLWPRRVLLVHRFKQELSSNSERFVVRCGDTSTKFARWIDAVRIAKELASSTGSIVRISDYSRWEKQEGFNQPKTWRAHPDGELAPLRIGESRYPKMLLNSV